MTSNVFTYGSLMFPEVWQRVVSGRYRSASAVVEHHVRLAIRGETYPGMIERAGCRVTGVVYYEVDPQDVACLDHFEGGEYRRASLVALAEEIEIPVEAYLFEATQRLLETDWQPETFQMQRFLDSYCRDKLGD